MTPKAARQTEAFPAFYADLGGDEWRTPQVLFDELDKEFGFTIDVCASPDKPMCEHYYSPEDDGLIQDWQGVCWMNPPYSQMLPWMRKAYESSLAGTTVVCLVPVRSDLAWWHEYAMRGEIRFIRGRLHFSGPYKASFPSAIVVFRGKAL